MQSMRKMTLDVAEYGLLSGTWAKVGKSAYQRVTGEKVTKTNQGWDTGDGWVYQSRGAAMSAVNYKHQH